jgi:regulator of replication initiation timing
MNMISLNYKYKAVLLAALLLLVCPVSFQLGQMSGRKDAAKAQAELAKVKMEYAQYTADLSAAHAAALKKANAALLEQQHKTAAISQRLVAANAVTKNKANKLKDEVIKNEKNNNCTGLDANGVHIYNAAFGYE